MISIIIPIYNTEKYLRECLSSVLKQTYSNFEVLLIDDGSTDSVPYVCREFMQKDSRIRFYSQGHQGVSAARNKALDMAKGEYVFFVDSDDMIAPVLLQRLYEQLEMRKVEMAYCHYFISEVEKEVASLKKKEEKAAEWTLFDQDQLIEKCHETGVFCGIGGKMILKNAIGALRFENGLIAGEDTLFLYKLIQKRISAVCTSEKMYYYRKHENNCSALKSKLEGVLSIESVVKRLAFRERQCGREENARKWEVHYLNSLKQVADHLDKKELNKLRSDVARELRKPSSRNQTLRFRIAVFLVYFYPRLYLVIKSSYRFLTGTKGKTIVNKFERNESIGILTFYWADDYGALLQSYALKTYLNKYQKAVLIPYVPKALRSRYCLLEDNTDTSLMRSCYKKAKRILSRTFFNELIVKCKMSRFRAKYLINTYQRLDNSEDICKFRKDIGTYVIGSDQVWNPEITDGFQEGYFCTFRQWRKEISRYVAYAVSIGTERLNEQYDQAFSKLLVNFDAISLREPSAVLYVESLCDKTLDVVLDPVFLLEREEWELLLRTGGKVKYREYIAVYYTEYNQVMSEYLKELEKYTGLNVLILKPQTEEIYYWTDNQVYATSCGPIEFLELVNHANYVVTNSLHGVALSIIFHKKFAVFQHSVRNARLLDLLQLVQLESRIVGTREEVGEINKSIDWEKVDELLNEKIEYSKEFIRKEIFANKNSFDAT